MKIYVIAWTGGYEMPQYEAYGTLKTAQDRLEEWVASASQDPDDGDQFDIFSIDVSPEALSNTGQWPIEALAINAGQWS